jgi:hypothetical protein
LDVAATLSFAYGPFKIGLLNNDDEKLLKLIVRVVTPPLATDALADAL